MFQEFKTQAKEAVKKALKKRGIEREIPFDEPPADFGDLSTSVCFELAPIMKKSPVAIAEEFVKEIVASGAIKEVKTVKGYINFYLDHEKMAVALIKEIKKSGEEYGKEKGKEKIVLEHTSANPDGPLHIGHGRNAIIGDSLARIMRFAGHKVETQYYLNDMGKQLAVVVWGLRKYKLDKAKKKDDAIAEVYIQANKVLEENPGYENEISELLSAYELGKKEVKKEFEDAANYCMEGMLETLKKMNISHDAIVWESTFLRDSSVKKVIERVKKTEYFKVDEVQLLDLSKFGIDKELILTRKDGTSLYATRDIAYHLWKSKKGTMIDILGADHKLLAAQVGTVLKILGEKPPEPIIYEFISLPESKMSTRRGIFVSVDELLGECIKRAFEEVSKRRPDVPKEVREKIAASVGTGAVRFNIVKISPDKSMTFKWEEALDFERQGSPFVQYAHARACRILEKADVKKDFETVRLSDSEKKLLKVLSKFPAVVEDSARERKPHFVAVYALDLADAFHKFYMFESVLRSEEKEFRLNLVLATKIVLSNALSLLGIEPLEAM